MNDIAIVGAGLVGTVLAIHLANKNYKVSVYDRCPDPRSVKIKRSDRSLMIVLSARGLHSLDAAGLGDAVREVSIPIYGRGIHDVEGDVVFQPYGNNREALMAVDRNELNETLLLEAAKHDNIQFYFEHDCVDVDLSLPQLTFSDAQGEQKTVLHSRVIAADGAYSKIRLAMQKTRYFNFSQEYLPRAYKEIVIKPPASPASTCAKESEAKSNEEAQGLSPNTFHIWPRGSFMLSAFPKADGSFSLSLQLPRDGDINFDTLQTESALMAFFEEYFPDVVPLADGKLTDFLDRPDGSMLTVRAFPWAYQDKVLLIGDAAHGILPFLGQGANSGFEDCMELLACMDEHAGDWRKIFTTFEQARKPNADTIADLSYENYLVLQGKVGDANFLLRKQIERKIQDLFPDEVSASLYHNVAFTRMPYVEALAVDKAYQQVIDVIIATDNIATVIDEPQGEQIIRDAMATHWISK